MPLCMLILLDHCIAFTISLTGTAQLSSRSQVLIVAKGISRTSLAKPCWLVLDGEVLPSSALVLGTNKVGNLFVLCLLYSRLVVLRPLTEDVLLNSVDPCAMNQSLYSKRKSHLSEVRTANDCIS